jgi:protein TonB
MKSSWRPQEKALNYRGIPWRALGWSLLLHGLVLAMAAPRFSEQVKAVPPPLPLYGMLLSAPTATHETSGEQQQRPVPEKSVVAKQKPVVVADPTQTPAPLAVPPAPSFPQATTVDSAARREEPARASERETASLAWSERASAVGNLPANAALRRDSDEQGASLSGIRQFRLALAIEARRYRRYPEMARRAGLAGTADVRVSIDAAGSGRQVELGHTSGNPTLDAAALEMMRLAVQRAVLPDSLRGQSFAVLLPVVFEIEQ